MGRIQEDRGEWLNCKAMIISCTGLSISRIFITNEIFVIKRLHFIFCRINFLSNKNKKYARMHFLIKYKARVRLDFCSEMWKYSKSPKIRKIGWTDEWGRESNYPLCSHSYVTISPEFQFYSVHFSLTSLWNITSTI